MPALTCGRDAARNSKHVRTQRWRQMTAKLIKASKARWLGVQGLGGHS